MARRIQITRAVAGLLLADAIRGALCGVLACAVLLALFGCEVTQYHSDVAAQVCRAVGQEVSAVMRDGTVLTVRCANGLLLQVRI